MENQEFYKDDIAHLEISTNVFCEVKVIAIKRAYGHVRYTVKLVKGAGELTTERLFKIKK